MIDFEKDWQRTHNISLNVAMPDIDNHYYFHGIRTVYCTLTRIVDGVEVTQKVNHRLCARIFQASQKETADLRSFRMRHPA